LWFNLSEALTLGFFDHAEACPLWFDLAVVLSLWFQEIKRERRLQKVAWEEHQEELVGGNVRTH
jgi:hypothetical protein